MTLWRRSDYQRTFVWESARPPLASGDSGGERNAAAVKRVSSTVAINVSDLVTVYWRPGCPYCGALRRGLRRAGLATTEVNIWEDPDAAAVVRTMAGGNETVPTVVIAGTGYVNPGVRNVLDAVRAVAPDLVVEARPAKRVRPLEMLAVVQWLLVITLLVGSFAVEAAGYPGISWAIDGVNVVIFGGIRILRRRRGERRTSNV